MKNFVYVYFLMQHVLGMILSYLHLVLELPCILIDIIARHELLHAVIIS